MPMYLGVVETQDARREPRLEHGLTRRKMIPFAASESAGGAAAKTVCPPRRVCSVSLLLERCQSLGGVRCSRHADPRRIVRAHQRSQVPSASARQRNLCEHDPLHSSAEQYADGLKRAVSTLACAPCAWHARTMAASASTTPTLERLPHAALAEISVREQIAGARDRPEIRGVTLVTAATHDVSLLDARRRPPLLSPSRCSTRRNDPAGPHPNKQTLHRFTSPILAARRLSRRRSDHAAIAAKCIFNSIDRADVVEMRVEPLDVVEVLDVIADRACVRAARATWPAQSVGTELAGLPKWERTNRIAAAHNETWGALQ